jgi:hypothetical protein
MVTGLPTLRLTFYHSTTIQHCKWGGGADYMTRKLRAVIGCILHHKDAFQMTSVTFSYGLGSVDPHRTSH